MATTRSEEPEVDDVFIPVEPLEAREREHRRRKTDPPAPPRAGGMAVTTCASCGRPFTPKIRGFGRRKQAVYCRGACRARAPRMRARMALDCACAESGARDG